MQDDIVSILERAIDEILWKRARDQALRIVPDYSFEVGYNNGLNDSKAIIKEIVGNLTGDKDED